ncbi:hypothetical protein PV08_06997 [Exophiala spinifera]|uniref:Beta-lactamase-related domain-containing protein n=1 Tax=Exophiala spinifera TaxID=91928 RepID=A0A0D1YGU3_9EURO|nr:uncharacterized protein PV08_06997 [Exophiala spinifera]KIW14216.1 hypothetical protein PV08_06997 [Exophiala spinifera]
MDVILTDRYEARVNFLLAKYHVPGISISITNANRTVSKGFGLANVEPPRPVTTETIFDCSRAGMSLTAAAAATLVADQRVRWDTPVPELLPGFRLHSWDEPKFADILCHKSGVPGHPHSIMSQTAEHPDTPASVANKACYLETNSDRLDYYSDLMYTTASYLIEQISGQSFESYLVSHILVPLGIESTYLQPSRVQATHQAHHLATWHVYEENSHSYKAVASRDKPECQGAGMIYSTAAEFVKWLRAQLRLDPALFGPKMYRTLLKGRTYSTCLDPRPFMTQPQYTLGWNVRHYRNHRLVYQEGMSRAMFVPDAQEPFGFVILGNSAGIKYVAEILAMELVDELLGFPKEWRGHWEPLEDVQVQFERDLALWTYGQVEEQALSSCLDGYRRPSDKSQQRRSTVTPYPLTAYTGRYRHAGYGDIVVTTKLTSATLVNNAAPNASDMETTMIERLYIDATDRTVPFTLTLYPLCFCECQVHRGIMSKFLGLKETDQRSGFIHVAAETAPRPECQADAEWGNLLEGEAPIIQEIGLDLCLDLRTPDLVWFRRVSD